VSVVKLIKSGYFSPGDFIDELIATYFGYIAAPSAGYICTSSTRISRCWLNWLSFV
jgi:hypothetical protein